MKIQQSEPDGQKRPTRDQLERAFLSYYRADRSIVAHRQAPRLSPASRVIAALIAYHPTREPLPWAALRDQLRVDIAAARDISPRLSRGYMGTWELLIYTGDADPARVLWMLNASEHMSCEDLARVGSPDEVLAALGASLDWRAVLRASGATPKNPVPPWKRSR